MILPMRNYLTGANGIAEAMRRGRGVLYFSRQSKRAAELMALAEHHGVPCRKVSDQDIARMVPSGIHRGYTLEIDTRDDGRRIRELTDLWVSAGESSLVVVLDGITDPRNLGAVVRASDQFSAEAVVVPKRRAAGQDADTLSRASAGAVEWIPIIEVTNINQSLNEFKDNGYWIWGADMEGEGPHRVNLKGRIVLVMGREGEGMHRLVRERCDGLIRIPATGRIDSLNVATAAGILMYEVRRQQGFKAPLKNPLSESGAEIFH